MERRAIRIGLGGLLVLSVVVLIQGALTAPTTASAASVPDAPPRDAVTVVTESGKFGTIIAWHPNGSLLYYNDTRSKYFDVDPVEDESMTVEYAATDTIHAPGPTCSSPPCSRNVIERVNLSTGEIEVVYARFVHKKHAGEWHDHVRIDSTHILIADIVQDRVFIVNTETEIVEWQWDAQSEFPVEGGGPHPDDWTHLNDVELLEDGRAMVSLRNQDQVVFLDPETGLIDGWTLGREDDYDVLNEQHNPDYIPRERGGPAVLVADSENNRVVEYQRTNGGWNRTWQWTDDRLQWPRDADRLPDGNTLIVDTHGKRVIEVAPDGRIVWSVSASLPYDAERLGTGPGSTNGESATRLGIESRTRGGDEGGFNPLVALGDLVVALLPSRLVNATIFVAPVWMGRLQFLAATIGLVSGLTWLGLEVRWRLPAIGIGVRSPVYRK